MPVTDPTGFDWNSQYRMPQGWTTLPDGSVGPSSGLPDWLKQLIPNPGAATPNAPGLQAGQGPQGLMPGGGALGRQAATPGAPSMGFPAQGGATSLLSALAGGNPYARAMIAAGGVMSPTPAETGELPLSMSGARPMHPSSTGAMPGQPAQPGADGVNPYAAAAAANPPQGGPYVGGQPGHAPGFSGMPARPVTPTPQNYPSWPTPGPGPTPASTVPTGQPSDTPRPGGSSGPTGAPYPPRRPKNLGGTPTAPAGAPSGNPRFGLYQPQVPGSGQGGPLSRSPIYTALNLFGGRS